MDNPYRRLRELTLTSQLDFGKKHGFSKTTMSYVEAGVFPEISERLNIALGNECFEKQVDAKSVLLAEYGTESLDEAYAKWQHSEREQVAGQFQHRPREVKFDSEESPFHVFTIDIAGSRQGFCKMLKVPAATVMRYAEGTTHTMPKSIEDALREVKYPFLADLLALQNNWADAA